MSDEHTPKPPPPPWERGREDEPTQTGSGGTGGAPPPPPPRRTGGGPPEPPYQPPQNTDYPSGGGYDPNAAARVKAPAITMIIIGAIGIVMNTLGGIYSLMTAGAAGELITPEMMDMLNESMGPELAQNYVDFINLTQSPAYAIVNLIMGLAVNAFVIFGAYQMLKLQRWGIAVGAAILGMIPCISPCCCLLLPIGIWALIVLFDEDVKNAFY